MSTDIVEYHGNAIATAGEVVAQSKRIQEIMQAVMKGPSKENPTGVHYGVIPGTKKNTLYKPGAEVLCVAFHIAPTYPDVVEERWDDGVRYRVKCVGIHQGSGVVVAEGLGSCSSMEEKYKWRRTYVTKEFETTPVDRRRIDYWEGRDGKTGENLQVRTETADIENTLLKMASKRAMIAMVLNALAASDVFAQDLEDLSKKVLEGVIDGEIGTDGKKPFVEPGKKGAGTVDTTTGEVRQNGNGGSPIASDGMLKWSENKLTAAGTTLAAAKAHFKVDKPTEADCKEFVKWAQTPAGEPTGTPAA